MIDSKAWLDPPGRAFMEVESFLSLVDVGRVSVISILEIETSPVPVCIELPVERLKR